MSLFFKYGYDPMDAFLASSIFGGLTAIAIIAFLITIPFIVVGIVAEVKLFKKCGKEGWKAIIPFYSTYVFTVEICGLHWAWFVATLATSLLSISNSVIRLLHIFINAMSFYNLATKCNKDKIASMIFGGLFPAITSMVYGFSKLDYDNSIPVKESGVF